jgi:pteridine reductase
MPEQVFPAPTVPVVLITGAARRIGATVARTLHAAGASIAIHANASMTEAVNLMAELNTKRPDSAKAFQADLRPTDAAKYLIEEVVYQFGRIDGLVNNASSFFPTAIGDMDEAAWQDLVGTNFKAPLMLCQAAALHLQRSGGSIVNITDIHAEKPLPGYPLYSAAKGALLTLTRAMAIELAPAVRVNAVAPGPILWPDDEKFPVNERQAIIEHTLLKRAGSPVEIANAVKFLLLDATYVTGQVLNVDGGRTAHL